ncbi:MAG: hypothetical protein LBH67_03455 [Rickettsia sp.]|jgi:hypothetical protein|nr:hypothetical protein [Rickettsia sp.]
MYEKRNVNGAVAKLSSLEVCPFDEFVIPYRTDKKWKVGTEGLLWL